MAFRGRGRGRGFGRGRGGGGVAFDRFAKPEPFVLFPEDVKLPPLPRKESDQGTKKEDVKPSAPPTKVPAQDAKRKLSDQDRYRLVGMKRTLESFWRNSCYHLEDASDKSYDFDKEIQRYSDRDKQHAKRRRENLVLYLKLIPSNFPSELIQGSKRPQSGQKKLRWDKDVDSKRLDFFERLESSGKSKNDEDKEKKGGDDGEDDEQLQEAEDESDDDGDYNQNRDFDDDEDDLNMEEEPDEDTYE